MLEEKLSELLINAKNKDESNAIQNIRVAANKDEKLASEYLMIWEKCKNPKVLYKLKDMIDREWRRYPESAVKLAHRIAAFAEYDGIEELVNVDKSAKLYFADMHKIKHTRAYLICLNDSLDTANLSQRIFEHYPHINENILHTLRRTPYKNSVLHALDYSEVFDVLSKTEHKDIVTGIFANSRTPEDSIECAKALKSDNYFVAEALNMTINKHASMAKKVAGIFQKKESEPAAKAISRINKSFVDDNTKERLYSMFDRRINDKGFEVVAECLAETLRTGVNETELQQYIFMSGKLLEKEIDVTPTIVRGIERLVGEPTWEADKKKFDYYEAMDVYKSEVVRDCLDQFKFPKIASDLIYIAARNTIEIAEISTKALSKYEGNVVKGFSAILKMISRHNRSLTKSAALVFDKYADKSEYLVEALNNNLPIVSTYDYKELLTDVAEKAISNSKNPAKTILRILESKYSKIRDEINDYIKNEFFSKLGYKELDLINQTTDFVMEFHRARPSPMKAAIARGFYQEMNRAIEQVDDYNDKVANLRQYCFNVHARMMEDAEELMVIHDA